MNILYEAYCEVKTFIVHKPAFLLLNTGAYGFPPDLFHDKIFSK